MDRVRLALIAAVALASCHRETQLAPRALPGFSLALPTGLIIGKPKLEYASGLLAIASDSPTEVALVAWSAGTKLADDELKLVLLALGPMVHSPVPGTVTSEPGPGGKPVETLRVVTDAVPMLVTQIECGGRNIVLCTGRESAGEDFHHRVLMTLQCKPDPAGEATLRDVHIDLQLELPGWYAVSHDDNQLQLSNGVAALILQPMATTAEGQLMHAIAPVLTAAFHGAVTAEEHDGRVVLHGAVDGEPLVGWAKLIPCPRSITLAMAMAGDQPGADALEHAVAIATCLAPGAPRQTWPDAPAAAPP